MHRRLNVLLAFLAGVVLTHLAGGPPPAGSAEPSGFAGVIARADGSVAHVTIQLDGDREVASRDDAVGAGFVYAADGYVVTSRHTLQGARKVFVTLAGRGTLEADVVGADEITDVALLRVAATGLVPLRVGNPRRLRKGDWVLAAGSPFHLPRSWSAGIVSGLGRSGVGVHLRGYEDFIQTDAAANVGNSGGPLLNAQGEVVGMMTAILSRTGRSEGVGLAVPVDVVVDAAARLRAGRGTRRPSIGVVVRETDVRGSGRPGLRVTRFEPGSPARRAGLEAGDVIVEVDGVPTARVADLQRAIWRRAPGSSATVVFVRGGRRLQAAVRVE